MTHDTRSARLHGGDSPADPVTGSVTSAVAGESGAVLGSNAPAHSSPLSWRVGNAQPRYIFDRGWNTIARCGDPDHAALIVRCVTAHQEIADAIFAASGMRSNHLPSDVTSLIRVLRRTQGERDELLAALKELWADARELADWDIEYTERIEAVIAHAQR